MVAINLRDYYPFYTQDEFINVPDEVAETIREYDLKESAYLLRKYRYQAYYSLDYGDGIEHKATSTISSPPELFEHQVSKAQLYEALSSLTEKQLKRTYAHYFLGMSKSIIAQQEGVNESKIRKSITAALKKMEFHLKKSQ